jgi:hypothetical protein
VFLALAVAAYANVEAAATTRVAARVVLRMRVPPKRWDRDCERDR